jgi:hypothetical protein
VKEERGVRKGKREIEMKGEEEEEDRSKEE